LRRERRDGSKLGRRRGNLGRWRGGRRWRDRYCADPEAEIREGCRSRSRRAAISGRRADGALHGSGPADYRRWCNGGGKGCAHRAAWLTQHPAWHCRMDARQTDRGRGHGSHVPLPSPTANSCVSQTFEHRPFSRSGRRVGGDCGAEQTAQLGARTVGGRVHVLPPARSESECGRCPGAPGRSPHEAELSQPARSGG
jgi:hypothetical protein